MQASDKDGFIQHLTVLSVNVINAFGLVNNQDNVWEASLSSHLFSRQYFRSFVFQSKRLLAALVG